MIQGSQASQHRHCHHAQSPLPAQGTVPALQLGVAGALLAGCGVASSTLWYYSRRYVGELALRADRPGRVTVSVLDFWGNREVKRQCSLCICSLEACRARLFGRPSDTR